MKQEIVAYKSVEEVLTAFDLNYDVKKVPLFINRKGLHAIDGRSAIVRTDTNQVLGVVSSKYPEISPMEKFKMFDEFAKEGIIDFVGGGSNAGRIYVQARIPNSMNVNPDKGDIIEKRITFHSSYDGSLSNEISLDMLRLVCTNGLTVNSKEWISKFKNSKNVMSKFDAATLMIEGAVNEYRNLDQLIHATTQTREFNDRELKRFVEMVLPNTSTDKEPSTRLLNRRTLLEEAIHTGVGQDVIDRMTAYKLLQGATYFTNHILSEEADDAFSYISFGNGATINRRALNLATEAISNPNIFSN